MYDVDAAALVEVGVELTDEALSIDTRCITADRVTVTVYDVGPETVTVDGDVATPVDGDPDEGEWTVTESVLPLST